MVEPESEPSVLQGGVESSFSLVDGKIGNRFGFEDDMSGHGEKHTSTTFVKFGEGEIEVLNLVRRTFQVPGLGFFPAELAVGHFER